MVRRAWLEHLFANVDLLAISDPRLRRTVEELRHDLTHPLFLKQKELEEIERILLRKSPVARELFAHYYAKRRKDPYGSGSGLKYFLSAGTFTDPLAWKIAEGIAEQHHIPEDHPQRRLYTPGGLYLPDLQQAISLLANKAIGRPELVLPAEFHEEVSSSEDPLAELRSHKISPAYDVAPSALDRAHPHIRNFVDIATKEFAKLISPKQDLMALHREYSALRDDISSHQARLRKYDVCDGVPSAFYDEVHRTAERAKRLRRRLEGRLLHTLSLPFKHSFRYLRIPEEAAVAVAHGLYLFSVPETGADLLSVLFQVAGYGPARTVAEAVLFLVVRKA